MSRNKKQLNSQILSRGGFSVPGIQVLSEGPKTTELRYFRKHEQEYAKASLDLVKDSVEIKLIYVPDYEAATGIRDRHFEIWFAESAFN